MVGLKYDWLVCDGLTDGRILWPIKPCCELVLEGLAEFQKKEEYRDEFYLMDSREIC
jgi:hypothetical protein